MKTASIAVREDPWRRIGALVGAVALSATLLSGCGDDSSPEGNTTGRSADQKADGTKASRPALPEHFPEEVPLPEFTSASKIGGQSGPDVDSPWWSVLLMLEEPTTTPVEDYAAQLTSAGYTVTTDTYATEAVGADWEISFHSSMENTLTVSVIGR